MVLVSVLEPYITLILTARFKHSHMTADISINVYGEQILFSSRYCRPDSCPVLSAVISASNSVSVRTVALLSDPHAVKPPNCG